MLKTSEMVYKKGLAVQIRGIEERAGEYHGDLDYSLTLHFKSKNAIANACKILGFRLGNKSALQKRFDLGYKSQDVRISRSAESVLNLTFGYKYHVGPRGYVYDYVNEYEGVHFSVRIDPRDVYSKAERKYLDVLMGPTASCNYSLEEYLEDVKNQLENGNIVYCNHI